MYALSIVAALFTCHKNYDFFALESFFGVYLACVFLMLFPTNALRKLCHGRGINLRAVVRGIIYIIIYPLSLIDVYCFEKFDTAINPSILMLAGETDTREAGEFLSTYVSPDLLLSGVGAVLLVLAIHIIANFTPKIPERYIYVKWANKPIRGTAKELVINCFLTIIVIVSGAFSINNYVMMADLLMQKTIGDVEHKLTEDEKAHQFLPLYRAAFSIYANYLTAQQISVLHRVVNETTVDSCSVTSPNIVLIIGEAYSRSHSELYGYDHPTTPHQLSMRDEGNLIAFSNVVAPWNLTSYVFKHVMSTYVVGDSGDWCDYPLFGTIFRKAGYHVSFLTNEFLPQAKQAVYDFSGGFFLNDPVLSSAQFDTRNQQLHLFDEDLLKDYDNLKHDIYGTHGDSIDGCKTPHLTIFHMIGQHVGYHIRYPQRMKQFTKDSYPEREDIGERWKKNLAHYDNATYYNDYVLSEIVKRFHGNNTIIIYMPDHGEEVHPRELPAFFGRMHSEAINERLAREEFSIPFWIYATPEYQAAHPDIWSAVKAAQNKRYMTDALPHLLMYLAGIHCKYYRNDLNILAPEYNESRPRIIKHQVDYDKVVAPSDSPEMGEKQL